MTGIKTISKVANYDEMGMVLKPGLSWKSAEIVADTLTRMDKTIAWWVGDFLNYAEKEYEDKYLQFVPDGNKADTWRQYKWVSERIPIDYRRPELSWSHHRVVAKLELVHVAKYLEIAVNQKLSKSELEHRIKELDPPPDPVKEDDKNEATVIDNPPIEAVCPDCGARFEIVL